VQHHPKEQYLPASVLEEHSTFSTLLDNNGNSTYSEYNDESEYVLPLQLHSDTHMHSQGDHNTNTTSKLTGNTAVDKKVANNSIPSSVTGAVTTHHKAAVHKSPQQTHHNAKPQHQHQPHNHVQFQVSDDTYSDHGDEEEGVPMSAPTAGLSSFSFSILCLLNPQQFVACEHIFLLTLNVLCFNLRLHRF